MFILPPYAKLEPFVSGIQDLNLKPTVQITYPATAPLSLDPNVGYGLLNGDQIPESGKGEHHAEHYPRLVR